MNLEQTIAELERQAAQYTEAANTLRALLNEQGADAIDSSEPPAPKTVARRGAAKKAAGKGSGRRGGRQAGKRGPVSDETRAKISEKLRASHAQRKAQVQASA